MGYTTEMVRKWRLGCDQSRHFTLVSAFVFLRNALWHHRNCGKRLLQIVNRPRAFSIPTESPTILPGNLLSSTTFGGRPTESLRNKRVFLLHHCNRQRKIWDPLACQLAAVRINIRTLTGENAKRALELLPSDTTDPEDRRKGSRDSSGQKLKQLAKSRSSTTLRPRATASRASDNQPCLIPVYLIS